MPEEVKMEKWMEAVEEELYEQEFGFLARARIMAILSRHYAAREREVRVSCERCREYRPADEAWICPDCAAQGEPHD